MSNGTAGCRAWERGFTLVEVLVAVAIFAGAILVLFMMFHSGALESKIGEDRIKGMLVAQREIERVKQVAALGRGSLEEYWAKNGRSRSVVLDEIYHVTVEVEPAKKVTVGGSQAELAEVRVRVAWDRPGRAAQTLEVSTLFDQAYF